MVMIELDSAIIPNQIYPQAIKEAVFNVEKLNYEIDFDGLPAGIYVIVVSDTLGCSLELSTLVPLDVDLFIPNIFTPNGDEFNETFYIRNLPESDVSLVISNRWGKEVYSSTSYQNNWAGEGASDGVYYYRLIIGESKPIMGWVEILRGNKP